jgi:hypothetical protein
MCTQDSQQFKYAAQFPELWEQKFTWGKTSSPASVHHITFGKTLHAIFQHLREY